MATNFPGFLTRIGAPDRARAHALSPLILGFNAQVIQLALFREALFLSSGSETALGICLAAWALFNGAGSAFGWLLLKLGRRPGRFFIVELSSLPLLLALSVHVARSGRSFVDVPGGEHLGPLAFTVMAVLVLAPVTFLDGLLFTSALQSLFGKRGGGRSASYVYGVESTGSLIGGVLFAFLFVAFMDPFTLAGLLLLINALALPLTRWPRLILFLLGVAVFVAGSGLNQGSEARRWAILQPDLEWIESRETRYQNLALLKLREEYSVFGNGHLLFTLRSKSVEESGDWDQAVAPNFAMLQHPSPENVLLLGGGPRGFVSDLLEYKPGKLDWVEYDEGLVALAAAYQLASEREAFNADPVAFHARDGRYFVKTAPPGSYDVIVTDLPDPSNANLNRYYTEEFFRECKRALTEDGVLVMGLSCQPNYIGETMLERNGSVYRAMKNVFSQVLITPGSHSQFAAGSAITAEAEELVRRYKERGLESKRFSPYLFYTFFEADDLEWINRLFEEHRGFMVNTDDHPHAYFLDYQLHAAVTTEPGEKERVASLAVTSLPWLAALLPAAGLLLFVFSFKRPKAGQSLLLLTALVTGFSGIALEVGLLMAFQNGSGHLYSQMGLIIAAYMAGLAAGALSPLGRHLFLLALASMAVGVGSAVFVVPLLPGGALLGFTLVTFLVGAAGGLSFRAVSLALSTRGSEGGGLIYTMDILGTCLGGWVAGSVLIPLLGISCTLAAAGLLMAFFCLLAAKSPTGT